MLERKLSF